MTQTDRAAIQRAVDARQLTHHVTVTSAPSEEMPRYWSLADAAISFIQPTFAKSASSPTKVGEALACGVPLIINRGVGDLDALVARYRCGVIVEPLSAVGYAASIASCERLWGEADLRERCRRAAEEALALSDGAARYARIYQSLGRP